MSDEYISWMDHTQIKPMYALRKPDGYPGVRFRRYEYGFLDIAVVEDDVLIQGATFELSKIAPLKQFLEWVVKTDDDYVYCDQGLELEAHRKLYIYRYIQSYNPRVDTPYPVNVHDPDESFEPDDDRVTLPRECAEALLEFIEDTNQIGFESVASLADSYDKKITFP